LPWAVRRLFYKDASEVGTQLLKDRFQVDRHVGGLDAINKLINGAEAQHLCTTHVPCGRVATNSSQFGNVRTLRIWQ
ncbi:hypothetical protein BAE44_0017129, partial [Dichanthelium oligosanthes]